MRVNLIWPLVCSCLLAARAEKYLLSCDPTQSAACMDIFCKILQFLETIEGNSVDVTILNGEEKELDPCSRTIPTTLPEISTSSLISSTATELVTSAASENEVSETTTTIAASTTESLAATTSTDNFDVETTAETLVVSTTADSATELTSQETETTSVYNTETPTTESDIIPTTTEAATTVTTELTTTSTAENIPTTTTTQLSTTEQTQQPETSATTSRTESATSSESQTETQTATQPETEATTAAEAAEANTTSSGAASATTTENPSTSESLTTTESVVFTETTAAENIETTTTANQQNVETTETVPVTETDPTEAAETETTAELSTNTPSVTSENDVTNEASGSGEGEFQFTTVSFESETSGVEILTTTEVVSNEPDNTTQEPEATEITQSIESTETAEQNLATTQLQTFTSEIQTSTIEISTATNTAESDSSTASPDTQTSSTQTPEQTTILEENTEQTSTSTSSTTPDSTTETEEPTTTTNYESSGDNSNIFTTTQFDEPSVTDGVTTTESLDIETTVETENEVTTSNVVATTPVDLDGDDDGDDAEDDAEDDTNDEVDSGETETESPTSIYPTTSPSSPSGYTTSSDSLCYYQAYFDQEPLFFSNQIFTYTLSDVQCLQILNDVKVEAVALYCVDEITEVDQLKTKHRIALKMSYDENVSKDICSSGNDQEDQDDEHSVTEMNQTSQSTEEPVIEEKTTTEGVKATTVNSAATEASSTSSTDQAETATQTDAQETTAAPTLDDETTQAPVWDDPTTTSDATSTIEIDFTPTDEDSSGSGENSTTESVFTTVVFSTEVETTTGQAITTEAFTTTEAPTTTASTTTASPCPLPDRCATGKDEVAGTCPEKFYPAQEEITGGDCSKNICWHCKQCSEECDNCKATAPECPCGSPKPQVYENDTPCCCVKTWTCPACPTATSNQTDFTTSQELISTTISEITTMMTSETVLETTTGKIMEWTTTQAITSIPTTTAKSIISGIISSAQIEIKLDADFDDALADTRSALYQQYRDDYIRDMKLAIIFKYSQNGITLTEDDIQIENIEFSAGSIYVKSNINISLDNVTEEILEKLQNQNNTLSEANDSEATPTSLEEIQKQAIAEALDLNKNLLNFLTNSTEIRDTITEAAQQQHQEQQQNITPSSNSTDVPATTAELRISDHFNLLDPEKIIDDGAVEFLCECQETGCEENSQVCLPCPEGKRPTSDSTPTRLACEDVPETTTEISIVETTTKSQIYIPTTEMTTRKPEITVVTSTTANGMTPVTGIGETSVADTDEETSAGEVEITTTAVSDVTEPSSTPETEAETSTNPPPGTKPMEGTCEISAACPQNSVCRNMPNNQYYCECKEHYLPQYDDNGSTISCFYAYNVDCPADNMTLKIYKDYIDSLNITPAYLKFDEDCDLQPEIEVDANGLDQFVYNFNLTESCGTKKSKKNEEFVYSNGVTYTFEDPLDNSPRKVERLRHRHLEFKCSYNATANIGMESPIQVIYLIEIEGEGEFYLKLNDYINDDFQVIHDNNEPISQNDYIYIKIETNSTDSQRTIQLDQCVVDAHLNAENQVSDNAIPFIENGCPLHESTKILENGVSQNIKFGSKIFEVADQFNAAYINCRIRFCDGDCELPNCDVNRRKRSAALNYHFQANDDKVVDVKVGPYKRMDSSIDNRRGDLVAAGAFSAMAWVGIALAALLIVGIVALFVNNRMRYIYQPTNGQKRTSLWPKVDLRLTNFKKFGSETDASSHTTIDNYFENTFNLDFLDDSEFYDQKSRNKRGKYTINHPSRPGSSQTQRSNDAILINRINSLHSSPKSKKSVNMMKTFSENGSSNSRSRKLAGTRNNSNFSGVVNHGFFE